MLSQLLKLDIIIVDHLLLHYVVTLLSLVLFIRAFLSFIPVHWLANDRINQFKSYKKSAVLTPAKCNMQLFCVYPEALPHIKYTGPHDSQNKSYFIICFYQKLVLFGQTLKDK